MDVYCSTVYRNENVKQPKCPTIRYEIDLNMAYSMEYHVSFKNNHNICVY